MRYLILVLMLTASFSQELEVEGNLKVQGNIDASNQRVTNVGSPTDLTDAVNTEFLQDALRDDGNYEYKIRFVQAWDSGSTMDFQFFKNEDSYQTQYNGGAHFNEDMLILLNDGYMIFQVTTANHMYEARPQSIWIYRRLVSDD